MDPADLTGLIMRHRAALHAWLLAATRNPHDAEDLLQEVSMAAVRSAAQFEAGTNVNAWLREIARRRLLEYGRERGRAAQPGLLETLEIAGRETDDEAPDLRRDALRSCLEGMPPTSRRVIEMRYAGSLSVERIAESLGRTVQAAYAILKRARVSLRDCTERKIGARA
jgi:RNA polymerase sigma-70 factor (ECF subfamily)